MTAEPAEQHGATEPLTIDGTPEQAERNQAAIALLRSWCEGDDADEQEQRETMQFLRRALDEGRRRIGACPLFS